MGVTSSTCIPSQNPSEPMASTASARPIHITATPATKPMLLEEGEVDMDIQETPCYQAAQPIAQPPLLTLLQQHTSASSSSSRVYSTTSRSSGPSGTVDSSRSLSTVSTVVLTPSSSIDPPPSEPDQLSEAQRSSLIKLKENLPSDPISAGACEWMISQLLSGNLTPFLGSNPFHQASQREWVHNETSRMAKTELEGVDVNTVEQIHVYFETDLKQNGIRMESECN